MKKFLALLALLMLPLVALAASNTRTRWTEVPELLRPGKSERLVFDCPVETEATVTVLDEEFDETMVYKIVGSQEADPMNGAISEDSPFGKALLGKSEGDQVVVDAPAGRIEYKLLKVEQR